MKLPWNCFRATRLLLFISKCCILYIALWNLQSKGLLAFFTYQLLGPCYLHEGSQWKKLLVLWVAKTEVKIIIHFTFLLWIMLKIILRLYLFQLKGGEKAVDPQFRHSSLGSSLCLYPLIIHWSSNEKAFPSPFNRTLEEALFFR